MLNRQTEQLERVLSDVLTKDTEIKGGLEASDLDVENLRDVVLRRKDEVWDACLAEQNAVAALETERLDVLSTRSQLERRSWTLLLLIVYVVPLPIIAAAVALFIGGYLTTNMGLNDFLTSGVGVRSLSFIALGALLFLGLRVVETRSRRAYVRRLDRQLRELDSALEAANGLLEQALREKGVRGMLREIINVRDPSYAQILQVQQAAGLAELRDPLYEIRIGAKERIQDLLGTMPCGSIGVSGPRGSGKTTLLRYFCSPRFAKQPGSGRPDLRVLISAPVQYDARDFVLYLFSAICQTVLGPEEASEAIRRGWQSRPERPESPLLDFAWWLIVPLAVMLPLYGVLLLLSVIFNWKLNPSLAPGLLLVVVGVAAFEHVRRVIWKRGGSIVVGGIELTFSDGGLTSRSREPDQAFERLRETARDLLLGLTYQQTFARGWTGAVKLPVGLEGGLNSTTTMMDRPLSYPEIVARLSDFLRQASVSRRVLIGIDEMDKIESDELANQFLNDLKAVFGLDNCFWLVSVSQSAMSAFERRGLPFRDVFDSSFDVIVEVDYLDLAASKRLLHRRAIGMSVPFLCLCHCLSGGLPRDLIRVARELIELSRAQASKELTDLTRALVTSDLDRKRRAVAIAAAGIELEPQTGKFLDTVEATRAATTPETLLAACRTLVKDPGDDWHNAADEAAEARTKLARLRIEFAAYLYYCATMMEFFNADLTMERLKAAEEAGGDMSIDQLARARQAFAVSPQVAWSTSSMFRWAHGMEKLVMGEPGEATTPSSPPGEAEAAIASPGFSG